MPGLTRVLMSRWRWALVVGVWLLALAAVLGEDPPADLARDGVAAYEAGDYEQAAALFEAALAAGGASPTLAYNLGSAYYEMGLLGPAMLNYRRAQQWTPRDTDVRAGLALVRAVRVDFQGDDAALVDRLATLSAGALTRPEQIALTLVIWTLGFGLAAAWVFGWLPRRRETTTALVAAALVVALAVVLLAARTYTDAARPSAIVLANVARVYSGPGADYLEIYRLHAAAELRLLTIDGDWARFVLPDGRQGWVALDAIERVDG